MKSLLAFAVVLVALRVLLLLAALEPAEERVVEVFDPVGIVWPYGPERPLFDREELYTGTAAEAMRRGLPIPSSTYQFMAYGGGSLLTAYAARVVYTVFGESYLAFKLLPLLVTLLGGLFWFAAVRRAFGERVATAFALLYAFAPSTFVRTLLIAKGDHSEAMAWIGFVVWTAVRATEPGPARTRWAALSGLAAGIGVFVTYSTVPVLAGAFGLAILLTRFRPLRTWAFGALGFGIGLIPWLTAVLSSEGGALRVYGRTLGTGGAEMGGRLSALFDTGFFAHYDLAGGAPVRQIAALIFLLAVGVGWAGWIRTVGVRRRGVKGGRDASLGGTSDDSKSNRQNGALVDRPEDWPVGMLIDRPDEGPDGTPQDRRDVSPDGRRTSWILLALAGTVAHLAAFTIAAPDAASRYVVPVYPLLLLPVACLVTGSRVARVLPGAVVAIGALALGTTLVQGAWTATRLPLSGTDWPLLGEIVGQKLSPDQIRALPADVRRHFWVGFGQKVVALTERDVWSEGVALAPEADQDAVWVGVGLALVNGGRSFSEGAYIRGLPPDARNAIVEGIARYGEVAFATVAVRRPDIDLGVAELQIAGTSMAALTESRARSVATLTIHGVEVSAGAWAGLPPHVIRRAIGFATFASTVDGSIRRYPIRTDRIPGIPDDDPELWAGLGAAYGVQLSLTRLSTEESLVKIAEVSARVPAAGRDRFAEAAEARLR